MNSIPHTRRQFLAITSATATALSLDPLCAIAKEANADLQGEVGVTTGSFMRHITFDSAPGKISMLELPKFMRGELDMRVIDLMNRTLESFRPAYLGKLRAAADENGCIYTNLKCNQPGLEMASADPGKRREAMRVYKESIDAAHLLGCRWIRPLPSGGHDTSGLIRLADAYRELIDYAAPREIGLLIENTGWVSNDVDAMPGMVAMVGDGLAASPDTGNWPNEELRTAGLTKAYPVAATSDFKAFQLEPDGSHSKYDLERCFALGWDAGYRGPWCIEHFNETLEGQLEGFAKVRDLLRGWIKARGGV